MIVAITEHNDEDPDNVFIVDMDKLPSSGYLGFRIAVKNAIDRGGQGTIDTEDSFSYGKWDEDACIDPPCHIDAIIELYTDE